MRNAVPCLLPKSSRPGKGQGPFPIPEGQNEVTGRLRKFADSRLLRELLGPGCWWKALPSRAGCQPINSQRVSSQGLGCPALGLREPGRPGIRTPGFEALLLPWRDLLQSCLRGLVSSSVLGAG